MVRVLEQVRCLGREPADEAGDSRAGDREVLQAGLGLGYHSRVGALGLEAVSFSVIVAEPCRPAWLSSWLCWPVIAPCQGRPLMR
ncbi:hypothetical protein, partial [Streptomyces ardesiacus]